MNLSQCLISSFLPFLVRKIDPLMHTSLCEGQLEHHVLFFVSEKNKKKGEWGKKKNEKKRLISVRSFLVFSAFVCFLFILKRTCNNSKSKMREGSFEFCNHSCWIIWKSRDIDNGEMFSGGHGGTTRKSEQKISPLFSCKENIWSHQTYCEWLSSWKNCWRFFLEKSACCPIPSCRQ